MAFYKNTSKGPRIARMRSGKEIFLQPGETKELETSKIHQLPDGIELQNPTQVDEKLLEGEAVPDMPADAKPEVETADLDACNSKAELLAIAEAEKIDVAQIKGTGAGGNVLMADIKIAIVAVRMSRA